MIEALVYLVIYTCPDISFVVNLLGRYNSLPTQRHWNGVKHLLRYLRDIMDIALFYSKVCKFELTGYVNVGYFSDPHNGRSEISYLFACGRMTISLRCVKKTISTTSSNLAELLTLHETNQECVWLRSLSQHVQETCGLASEKINTTTIYGDKIACIAQLKPGYIKRERTKHISLNIFSLMIFRKMVI